MTMDAERILTTGTAAEREIFLSNFDDPSQNTTVNRDITNPDFM
jgi:hypothetical protein